MQGMRRMKFPTREQISLTDVLYALSDPTRLEIVRSLANGTEMMCSDFRFAIAKSTLSHHFRVLRNSGVIYTRPQGTQNLNSLRRADLDARFPGLLAAILGNGLAERLSA